MEEGPVNRKIQIVIIGGSAGSLEVLFKVLPQLKSQLAVPLVIVVHRKSNGGSSLPDLLALKTSLPLTEVEDKDAILPGHIYLAPANYHILIENNGTLSLDDSEKVHFSRPSLDVTFESAADVYGINTAGILLSGANEDGTKGLKEIKRKGGIVIVQNPSTASMPIMPQSALNHVKADYVYEIDEIVDFLNNLPK